MTLLEHSILQIVDSDNFECSSKCKFACSVRNLINGVSYSSKTKILGADWSPGAGCRKLDSAIHRIAIFSSAFKMLKTYNMADTGQPTYKGTV